MITIRYVIKCDACGREVADEQPCQIIWGIDWTHPALPLGWKVLMDGLRGGQIICDHHPLSVEQVQPA